MLKRLNYALYRHTWEINNSTHIREVKTVKYLWYICVNVNTWIYEYENIWLLSLWVAHLGQGMCV